MTSNTERTRRGLQAFLLYLLLAATNAQAETFPPRNDALEAPGFKAFYSDLVQAINRKDASFMRSITDGESFVGSDVRNARAKPDWNNPNSAWWKLLGWAVDLGGVQRSGGTVLFPYAAAARVRDPFSHGVIVGKNVNIRSGPGRDYPAVGSSSYEIVTFNSASGEWCQITTPSGLTGYVIWRYLYTPGSATVTFKRVGNRWYLDRLSTGVD
jgi:uncharacterized protein YgiM (DUF1202 family)